MIDSLPEKLEDIIYKRYLSDDELSLEQIWKTKRI